jgi:amino acid adenylation domain-containing protein
MRMSDKLLFNAKPSSAPPRIVEHCSAGPSNDFTPFAKEEVEQSIPARFELQASKYPDRIAVKGQKYTFTYDALNRYSNRIARAILAREREQEEVIGLLLQKDGPLIAALLGVLKAGKIYVSLDPAQPGARAFKMLEDARASLVVTDEENLTAARALARGTRRLLSVRDIDSSVSEEDIPMAIAPDALAYIIYTSGSTGEPKGVIQNHRNVLHNIRRHTNSVHYCADDRITLLASCGTGQAVTDIYGALLNGATLCPFGIKEEGLARLATWLREEEITVYHSSVSVFRYFLGALDGVEAYPRLRLIKLGSEQVFKKDVDSFKKQFSPHCLLVNTLSASETGPVRQIFIGKDTSIHQSVVPVGFPVEDMEILLLNEAGKPVGFDSSGEIVIKSRYLALGYWRRPELTNEAFLPDPLGGGDRLFRTGDMGRIGPDGCMEYLGRKDMQVKIRGFRVEVAEVEAALLELGTLKQAAVVVSEDQRGEKSLMAYGVPAMNPAPSVASLRTSLREKLPDHMVPSEFILLERLPLSPSGKLDRSSLSSAMSRKEERDATYSVPQSPLEWQIVHIWEELLGVRPIGVQDDFFALGGHSLLAVRMMDRIEELCGTKLPLATLLAGVTVEHLAKSVLSANREKFRSPLVAVQPGGSAPPFFLLHGDFNGGGFYCRNLARYLGKDQPLYTLAPHGLDGEAIPDSIEEMAADRLSTLLEFRPTGPYLLGGHCNGGLVALEMARQLKARGLRVDLLVMIDAFALNAQFRWLRGFLSLVGLVIRVERTKQLDWFKKLRFYSIRLRELSTQGLRAQVSFAAEKIVRFMKILGSVLAFERRELVTEIPPAPGQIHDKRYTKYHSVIDDYVPVRYQGPVVFFRSHAMQSRSPSDPTAGWRNVARDVEVHWLPGDHLSCLTEHLETLAEHLASCLSAANGCAEFRPAASIKEHSLKDGK